MKDKYYDFTSTILIGISFIIIGIFLLLGKNQLYREIIQIIVFIFWGKAFIDMIHLFFRKEKNTKRKKRLCSCIFHLIICLIFSILPEVILGILPVLFAFYLILLGIIQFITSYLEIKNKEITSSFQILLGLFYFSFAITILASPISKLDTFLVCLSIYILFLGISFLGNAMIQIIPISTKNHWKRKFRITLPKIIEAIIPYSVMLEINHSLEISSDYHYSYTKNQKKEPELHILIHTSNRGFNRMGHIDICFENKVISYGNYDEGSRFVGQFFGDGILFLVEDKMKYINFCIENSKKTMFDFGIALNEKQKNRIQKRIEELMKNTTPWDPKMDKQYCNGTSYAGKLQKRTNAQFYKFKKGKYKIYFVLGTNCSFLADDIVGASGMDILSMNGIITPGTYYDYLNRRLMGKNSNVISKEIYNQDRKA